MNDDHRLLLEVRSWLQDEDVVLPDAEQAGRLVAAELPHTRQLRHRWWPLRIRGRTGGRPTMRKASDHKSVPIPDPNVRSATVIGRTQLMFSPSKAIIAGALVFAIFGVTLIPQPFEQQGGTPGAVTQDVAPTWVTGTIQPVDGTCSRGETTSDGGVTRSSYECSYTWTASDPRLTGDVRVPWNEATYQTDEGVIAVGIEAAYLRNEGGGWSCWYEYLAQGATPTEPVYDNTFTCAGNGGYEGLTAVVATTPTTGEFALEFVGLIFSGDLPPVPEASPAA
jgi:hypothetical protein